MLVGEQRQRLDRQVEITDRAEQLRRHRIALGAAMDMAGEHVGPPLQADFAGQGLAHLVADADDLDIEGIERQQRAALGSGREQGRGIARKVVAAHEVSTERGRIRRRHRATHGTAISAAATRRRSPIMML